MERKQHLDEGFTLIEIMAVVIIIGLLTGIVGTAIFSRVDQGKVTTAKAQISNLESVLELYRMDNGRFPTTEQGLEALVREPPAPTRRRATTRPAATCKGGRVPVDPWSNPYQYEAPGPAQPAVLRPLEPRGRRQRPAARAWTRDLGNWAGGRGAPPDGFGHATGGATCDPA